MTDDEFERIKEAEKERLRMQKRLHSTLESLKRRNEVQQVVRRMSQGAQRLLRQTETLADKVSTQAARQAARLEVARESRSDTDSLAEEEEAMREERAQDVVDRIKSRTAPSAASRRRDDGAAAEETEADDSTRPEKTIGRMGRLDGDDEV